MHLTKIEQTVISQTETKERKKSHVRNKIERTKKHMTRWDDYRKMKRGVVERYIAAKKKQRVAEEWNKLLRLGLHMKVFFKKRDELRAWKIWKMEINFISLMMTVRIKKRLKN